MERHALGPPVLEGEYETNAGLEIVKKIGPAPAWTLQQPPLLSVGTVDEEGPGQFDQVRDIELLPDGGLVVADQGSEELRFFGPDIVPRSSGRGEAQGPEEFRGLWMVESFGDSLLTYDGGNDRLSVRRSDGGFVRSSGSNGSTASCGQRTSPPTVASSGSPLAT